MTNIAKHIQIVTWALLISYTFGLLGWVYDYLEHLGVIYTLFAIDPYNTGIWNGHTPQYIGGLIILAALVPPQPDRLWNTALYAGFVLAIALRLFFNFSGAFVTGLFCTLLIPAGALLFHIKQKTLSPALAAVIGGVSLVTIALVIDRYWHLSHPEVTGPYNMLQAPAHVMELVGWMLGLVGAIVLFASWRQIAQPRVPLPG